MLGVSSLQTLFYNTLPSQPNHNAPSQQNHSDTRQMTRDESVLCFNAITFNGRHAVAFAVLFHNAHASNVISFLSCRHRLSSLFCFDDLAWTHRKAVSSEVQIAKHVVISVQPTLIGRPAPVPFISRSKTVSAHCCYQSGVNVTTGVTASPCLRPSEWD